MSVRQNDTINSVDLLTLKGGIFSAPTVYYLNHPTTCPFCPSTAGGGS